MASTCSWMHQDFWYLENILPVLWEASLRGIVENSPTPCPMFSLIMSAEQNYTKHLGWVAKHLQAQPHQHTTAIHSKMVWIFMQFALKLDKALLEALRCTSSLPCGVYAGNTPALLPVASQHPPGKGPSCSSVTYAEARWTPRRLAWLGTGLRTGGWQQSGGCPEPRRCHLTVAQQRWRTCYVPGSAAR